MPLRIVLCTSGGAPGAAVLERLLASPRVELAGLMLSTRVYGPDHSLLRGAWAHWRRSGLHYTLYLGRAAMPRLRAPGVPVIRSRNLNQEPVRVSIATLAPDLLLSAFFNQRIGEPVAAGARFGAINIHPSLLPALKGVDPVFYARLRGESALGVSVHRVNPQLDGGNLYAQRELPLVPSESLLAATTRLYAAGTGMLLDSLDRIAAGDPGWPQPAGGNYDSWPDRAQVATLRRKGVRLF